jgi:hypothetical protein
MSTSSWKFDSTGPKKPGDKRRKRREHVSRLGPSKPSFHFGQPSESKSKRSKRVGRRPQRELVLGRRVDDELATRRIRLLEIAEMLELDISKLPGRHPDEEWEALEDLVFAAMHTR